MGNHWDSDDEREYQAAHFASVRERQKHYGKLDAPDASERNLQRAVQDLGALERLRANPHVDAFAEWLLIERESMSESFREAADAVIALMQAGEVSRG